MKTIRITTLAVLGIILSACGNNSLGTQPGTPGAAVGIGSARIVAPSEVFVKSHTGESDPVVVLNDSETGTFLSITVTASPMASDEVQTRVTEKTTANLNSFTIQGYLGDEILTCENALQSDKDNRHFIDGKIVEKSTDGYWYFQGAATDAPEWRSCVEHHFWAYDGSPADFEVSSTGFNQASFSYTNDGTEDLIIGYQHQMWVDEVEGKIDNEDVYPLKNLLLKHALSEIVIDYSAIGMKMLNVVGGDYSDIPTSTKPGMNPRLSINKVLLLTPSEGNCDVTVGDNGVEFDWSCPVIDNKSIKGYTTVECTGNDPTSIFVIPQKPDANVVVLNVYDSWRDINTPIFIELPALSGGAEWQPGYRYHYKITGTLLAPYYTDMGELNPDFKGRDWQSFVIMKNLLSKYVKKIRVTWEGLPAVNSNSTPCAMLYLKDGEEPDEDSYPMNGLSNITWHTEDWVGFVAATKHQKVEGVIKGTATGTDDAATAKCSAEFIIKDGVYSPLTFYLLYKGDNNGNALWILKHLKVEVVEFKYPIQIT